MTSRPGQALLTVWLDEELFALVRGLAGARGVSEFVRFALLDAVEGGGSGGDRVAPGAGGGGADSVGGSGTAGGSGSGASVVGAVEPDGLIRVTSNGHVQFEGHEKFLRSVEEQVSVHRHRGVEQRIGYVNGRQEIIRRCQDCGEIL